jgi:hypothetical protein
MLDASGERFVATLLKVCHGTAFCAHTFCASALSRPELTGPLGGAHHSYPRTLRR